MRANRRLLFAYAVAVTASVSTVLAQWGLDRLLHGEATMLLLVVPVFISAHVGGIGPGLLAIVLTALGSSYLVLEPHFSLWVAGPPDQVRIIMFLVVGTLVNLLTERLRRVQFREAMHLSRLGAIEERFRLSKDQLRLMAAIVEGSDSFVSLCTPDFKPFYVNTAGRAMVGRENERIENTSLLDYFWPEDRSRIESEAIPALQRDGQWWGEVRLQNAKTRQAVETVWSPFAIRDDAGQIIAWAMISPEFTGFKRAQEALRESEEKFRAIFERAAIGMGRVDFTHARWIDVNDAFCRMLGYSAEEMRATPWPQMTHPHDVDKDLIPFRQMAAGEIDSYTVEKRFIHKQGHQIWARLTLSLVRDAQGQPHYEIAIVEDITQRKQAEEKLARSEERYRLLNRATHDVIWDWDLLTDRLEWNDSVVEAFGYQLEEMEPTIDSWYCRVHPEDRERVQSSIEAAIEGSDSTWTDEYRFLRKDGSYSHVLDRGLIARDEAGRGYRMIGSMIDLSERRRLEAALHESEAQFRQLADSMPQLVWMTRPDGYHEYFNERWYEYTGTMLDESRGELWALLLHPDDYQRTLERWHHSLRTGEPYEIEYRFKRASDGEYRWFLGRALPVRDESGAIIRWFGTCTDIQEQKETQEELEQRRKQLSEAQIGAELARAAAEEANASKDRFLAVLSHELRTPLTPVLASVSMLQKNPFLDERTVHSLELIRRNVELEARLIDDLLDLTRIARGKVELHMQPVPLCTVISRAVDVCRPDIEARGIHFGIDLGHEAPYPVEVDVARLQQVFWNLLKNSIKFTPKGGCLGIRVRRDNEYVNIDVSDSGVGIEAEALPRIFDAFAQADRAVTRQFGGLGLGLAISRSLVELHGGTIEAHSDGKDKGSMFRVRLPLQSAQNPLALMPTGTAPQGPPARQNRILRILVVEDHGDTADMMRLMLEAEGHEVETASDVAGGLRAICNGHFDVLISDLGLPDGSGLDLIRQVRSLGHLLPAIALSGYGQQTDMQQSRAAGFSAHITKPIDMDRLVGAIAELVR